MTVMNLLDFDNAVKGMSDAQLIEIAQNPQPGGVPQFMAIQQLQENRDNRERYAAQLNKPSDMTVADQIVSEAMQGGIMGAMPPQMAMAPQMAQRMPNMPPQGIQQAMPPEMMSGGGVARMFNGGGARGKNIIIQEILANNPNPTRADLLAAGITDEDIENYSYLLNPSALDRARSGVPFGPPASDIYPDINLTGIETMVNEGDRRALEKIRSGEKYAQRKAAYDARNRGPVVNDPDAIDFAERQLDILEDPSLLITDEERALNTEDVLNQRFDQAQQLARRLQAQRDQRLNEALILSPEDRALTEKDFADIKSMQRPLKQRLSEFASDSYDTLSDLAEAGFDRGIAGARKGIQLLSPSVSNLYDDVAQSGIAQQVSQLFSGPAPSANINQSVDDRVEALAFMDDPFADINFFDQSIYKGEYKGKDLGKGTPSDLAELTVGQENDRSTSNSILRGILEDQKSADRVDVGDASISGSKYAMGLQDLLDKEIANASNQNKAAMLLTLGGGILQGKTGEAAEKVAQIATKGAQTQSALRLEGAKMRMKDYRDSQRMDLMLKDILARAGVAESRSDAATLNGVNDAIRQITNTPEYQQELILSRESGEPGPRMLQLQDLNRARDLLFRKLSPGAFASRPAPTGGDILNIGNQLSS